MTAGSSDLLIDLSTGKVTWEQAEGGYLATWEQ